MVKSEAEGTIVEKSYTIVTKKIKGTEVKQKASKNEPSYVIEQANGNEVIKSESELTEGLKRNNNSQKKWINIFSINRQQLVILFNSFYNMSTLLFYITA